MSYFVIEYDTFCRKRGCPPMLTGDLNQDFQWDDFDPDPDKFAIKGEYVYKAKQRVIDFDFYHDCLPVSTRFADLCDRFGARTRRIPLTIIQAGGKETEKKYCYLLWKDWLPVLDTDRSEYELDRDLATGEIVYDRYFPQAPCYYRIFKFAIDECKVMGKHVFRCVETCDIVCDAAFKEACEREKFLGLKFIPLEEFQKKAAEDYLR